MGSLGRLESIPLKRRFRLTRQSDVKRVRRQGKSFAHPFVVLIALSNGTQQSHVAVAAGRSVGNAVERNRSKRVLRAAIQPFLSGLKPGYDLILLARKPALAIKSPEMHAIIEQLLQKARLLS